MKRFVRKMAKISCVMLILMQFSGALAAETPAIKGFNEWKTEKINLALQQTISLRNLVLKTKTFGPVKNVAALEKQLSQLNWNLEVARDLSVTDYFVLYLSQQPQADRFKMAASKLTTAEVADLMQAYAQSLSNSPNPAIETTSSSNFASQALVAPEGVK